MVRLHYLRDSRGRLDRNAATWVNHGKTYKPNGAREVARRLRQMNKRAS